MKLLNCIRPRWKHSDPRIRAKAVERLRNQKRLMEIAGNNDEVDLVRLAAIEKIEKQEDIADIAILSASPLVYLAAFDRITDSDIIGKIVREKKS